MGDEWEVIGTRDADVTLTCRSSPIPQPSALSLYSVRMIREPGETTGRGGRLKGRGAIGPRYGSTRSFVLRTLYSWLTLSMLYLFAWPLLVIYFGAPSVPPEETPANWYQFRLFAPLLIAAIVLWLWQLSPAPAGTALRARA